MSLKMSQIKRNHQTFIKDKLAYHVLKVKKNIFNITHNNTNIKDKKYLL